MPHLKRIHLCMSDSCRSKLRYTAYTTAVVRKQTRVLDILNGLTLYVEVSSTAHTRDKTCKGASPICTDCGQDPALRT